MQFECIFSWGFGDSLRQSRLPGYPFRLLTAFAATLPLLSLRDIFPRPGEVGPQGDGFSGGWKLCGSAERRPLGGAVAQRLRGYKKAPPSGELSSVCETERVRPPASQNHRLSRWLE